MPPKNPPKKVTKRTAKPVHLSVSQKLELLRKIDGGMSVAQVCELVQVVYPGACMWGGSEGVELAASAAKLAAHMGIEFKASDGWLWRFRRRHGIRNLAVTGEAESADAEMIEPFRDELMKLINDEDLSMSQIYNVDETVPEVKNYQEKVLKIRPDDVKALILLDNAPAHPSSDVLKSADGKIKAMFLPKNTTSLIQPMDQGVISAFKRIYLRKYLDDVLVVLETEDGAVEDTRGKRTLANIKNYNIRAAIYNMYEAWREMKHTTFTNAWKKLMKDEDYCADFEGFEATDFHQLLKKSGEEEVTVDDVDEWLEENDQTQGNEILNTEQIVAAVTGEESDSEDSDSGEVKPTVKMSVVRECADVLLKFVEDCSRQDIQIHYDQLRLLRSKIIRMQHESGRQTLIKEFFKALSDDISGYHI
ncbi:tigger transposable element-derived protein 7-like [Portunus trituberculatus]|uniref:tigger transposable element-derived protein 7-like n=1 Tax=Portunus trituberculatus TaxID=210409 RepID=UPI001E1CEB79|nr:tigger transposable element-derived protein 7-like [Portunus trituberculatus]